MSSQYYNTTQQLKLLAIGYLVANWSQSGFESSQSPEWVLWWLPCFVMPIFKNMVAVFDLALKCILRLLGSMLFEITSNLYLGNCSTKYICLHSSSGIWQDFTLIILGLEAWARRCWQRVWRSLNFRTWNTVGRPRATCPFRRLNATSRRPSTLCWRSSENTCTKCSTSLWLFR